MDDNGGQHEVSHAVLKKSTFNFLHIIWVMAKSKILTEILIAGFQSAKLLDLNDLIKESIIFSCS